MKKRAVISAVFAILFLLVFGCNDPELIIENEPFTANPAMRKLDSAYAETTDDSTSITPETEKKSDTSAAESDTTAPETSAEIIETTAAETSAPQTDSVKDTEPQTDTVYWVDGGEVWHTRADCSSLSRSKNVRSGTVSDAMAAGKSRVCKRCG